MREQNGERWRREWSPPPLVALTERARVVVPELFWHSQAKLPPSATSEAGLEALRASLVSDETVSWDSAYLTC